MYPNGDPVPAASSFIDLSGTSGTYPGGGGGGGGNPYIDNGYSYGPVTWTYYPPDNSGNDSGSSSGSENGCCSCGNCGTNYYPPSDRPNPIAQIYIPIADLGNDSAELHSVPAKYGRQSM